MEHLWSLKDPSVTNEQLKFVSNGIPGHFTLVPIIILSRYNAEFAIWLILKEEGDTNFWDCLVYNAKRMFLLKAQAAKSILFKGSKRGWKMVVKMNSDCCIND